MEKENLKREKEHIDNEMRKYIDETKRIQEEENTKKIHYKDQLKYQIQLREKERKEEKTNKIYEERAAQLWEKEYSEQIADQRKQQMDRVNYF